MKGFVYIIKDGLSNRFYIGSTNDVKRRMLQHSHGNTKTTNRTKEKAVVLIQEFDSLETARKIELRLKKFKRKDFIEKIVRDGYIKIN